jgi:hypothetical protein
VPELSNVMMLDEAERSFGLVIYFCADQPSEFLVAPAFRQDRLKVVCTTCSFKFVSPVTVVLADPDTGLVVSKAQVY